MTFSQKFKELPVPGDGEVSVQVTFCSICGSDLHTYCGRRQGPSTCVLGHEIIGRIAAVGGNEPVQDGFGNPLQIGQRVTWAMAYGCGECFFCQNRLAQKCVRLFKYGHELFDGVQSTGGLSEYCVLKQGTPIFSVPDQLADELAAPANCATATVMAASRLAGETHSIKSSHVLIIGLGMLGLTAVARFKQLGADEVIAVDIDPRRMELAKQFGATHVINANDPKIDSQVRRMSEDRGVDLAFDFSGATSAIEAAIKLVRVGGLVLLAGSVFPTDPLSLNPEQTVRKMLSIRGLHNYLPGDLAEAIRFLEKNGERFPFADLVEEVFGLDQVPEAFQFATTQRPVRVGIRPGNQ